MLHLFLYDFIFSILLHIVNHLHELLAQFISLLHGRGLAIYTDDRLGITLAEVNPLVREIELDAINICYGDILLLTIHLLNLELGKMKRAAEDEFSFEAFSLDATVFENKGEYYYVWAEKVGVGKMISNLYIAKMESGNQLKTVQVLLTTPDYDWERKGFWVNEGPAVIHHDGKMFLTYSASETGVDYCVGMLSIDEDADLLDPRLWKKERYPVLKTCEKLGIYGPGHNSFTVDEDGNDVMVYHARTEAEINGDPLYNPNRHAMLMKVKWDEAGRPVFSYENK